MRLRMLVVSAVLVAVAAPLAAVKPAQAGTGAAGFKGIVVAKQKQRGTLLIARAHGAGLTVRGGLARAKVGERVKIQGVRLHDGTIRMRRLHVLGHVRRATVRGTVLRSLARGTLVASGHSVVLIHRRGRQLASASDHGGVQSGDVAEFRVRFDDNDDLVQAGAATQVGQADTAQIEGRIVSLSPFVVSMEGLPITITVPAGMTLPASLAVGDRIELTVQVGAGNTFTLVAIDENENENENEDEAQKIEVEGVVSSSTASQLVVNADGASFTFVPPAGESLPVLATGTFVEARGVQQSDGTITLTRLEVQDQGDDGGGDGGGGSGGGGGDDGGG